MAKERTMIIGGGFAGLVAAATAVRQGAAVTVVTSGPGTVSLGSGGISFRDMDTEQAELPAAVELFTDMTAAAGCQYRGELKTSRLIPNVLGGFQQVSMAPAAVWNAGVENNQRVLIVGWSGWSGFNAQLTAELLTKTAAKMGLQVNYSAETIELNKWTNGELTALSIAMYMNDPDYRKMFASLLKPLIRDGQLLLLPAVLGTTTSHYELERFAVAVGCPIGEMISTPPAVSGLRMYTCLQKYLQKCGVEFRSAYPVRVLQGRDGYCQAAVLDTPGRPCVLKADRFIIATGRINQFSLSIEGIPTGQAIAETVSVDKFQHILNKDNRLVANNLYAAGSIIDNCHGSNGNAFALLTGYKAGMAAVRGDGAL